jgi:hypothetical protein
MLLLVTLLAHAGASEMVITGVSYNSAVLKQYATACAVWNPSAVTYARDNCFNST